MEMNVDIVRFTQDVLGLSISPAQEVLLRSIYGLPLPTSEQHDLFRLCTGRDAYPERRFAEATILAGARSGKDSRIAAPIACYEALFGGHERHLSKGERAVIPIVAQDLRATRIAFSYVKDYLLDSPLLRPFVADEKQNEVLLTNGLSIICFPCSLRSLRGWSIPCGILDELAFFRLEGQVDSDVEVQTSIRRGGISFPITTLVKISTPYMKSGVLHDDFKKGFRQDDPDLLVWKASTALMNPTITPERLAREKRLDPSRFAREYEAEFVDDLTAFLPAAWVDSAIVPGRRELSAYAGIRYVAGCDTSGGGADAFTFSIAHAEPDGSIVQDVLRGYGRGQNLESTVSEIAQTLRRHRLHSIHGDRYAANWVVEAFRRAGVRYEPSKAPDGSPLDQSRAYAECEPLFAQGRVRLLDHPKQREWMLLERRQRPGGSALITHPKGGHDDYAASAARAFVQLAPSAPTIRVRRMDLGLKATLARNASSFTD